jgi:hypothetical protein
MATQRLLLLPFLLLVGGCFKQDKNQTSQILPLAYPTGYSPVRFCRPIQGHTSNYIIVRATSDVGALYNAATGPLPQGSLLVAEEYDKADCTSLTGYTLMFKDAFTDPPTAEAWHWQRLDDQRIIAEDGRVQSCMTCHTLCNRNDYTCSPP